MSWSKITDSAVKATSLGGKVDFESDDFSPFGFKVVKGTPKNLSLDTALVKKSYHYGERLDLTGLKIHLDGETYDWGYTSSPANSEYLYSSGERDVIISVGDTVASFSITVDSSPTPVVLENIEIRTLPTKLEYMVGDAIDYSGMTVYAHYDNHTVQRIMNYTVSPVEGTILDTEGTLEITVQYQDKDATFEVEVEQFSGYRNLTFTAEQAGSTIGITRKTAGSELKYSFNGSTWTELEIGDTITLENVGDSVQFKGELVQPESRWTGTHFTITGGVLASGSIMSIVCNDPNATVIPFENCCCEMFKDCSGLLTSPILPATTLTRSCYESMFSSCMNIRNLAEIPATDLPDYCLEYMYYYVPIAWSETKSDALPYRYRIPAQGDSGTKGSNWNYYFTGSDYYSQMKADTIYYVANPPVPGPGDLQSIEVKTPAYKQHYNVGDRLTYAGLSVIGHYTNRDQDIISFVIAPSQGTILDTVGEKEITISAEGKQCTFTVDVQDEDTFDIILDKFIVPNYAKTLQINDYR